MTPRAGVHFVVVLQPGGFGTARAIERHVYAADLSAAQGVAARFGPLTATRYLEAFALFELGAPRPLAPGRCLGCGRHPRLHNRLYGACCIGNYKKESRAVDGWGRKPGPKAAS